MYQQDWWVNNGLTLEKHFVTRLTRHSSDLSHEDRLSAELGSALRVQSAALELARFVCPLARRGKLLYRVSSSYEVKLSTNAHTLPCFLEFLIGAQKAKLHSERGCVNLMSVYLVGEGQE